MQRHLFTRIAAVGFAVILAGCSMTDMMAKIKSGGLFFGARVASGSEDNFPYPF